MWDLDNTVWDGILLEDDDGRAAARRASTRIKPLDERGILHSIASRNDHERGDGASSRELGLDEYFLYPQINWNSKAASIEQIATGLNIGLDAIAFVDDQPFERDEVALRPPAGARASTPPTLATVCSTGRSCTPRFVTDDSRSSAPDVHGRHRARQRAEEEFVGPKEEFLATLGMRFTIRRRGEDDLQRAEELTVRTHQLNTTGYTYSYEELDALRTVAEHLLLVASLDDRYGTYGKIGLALVETGGRTGRSSCC